MDELRPCALALDLADVLLTGAQDAFLGLLPGVQGCHRRLPRRRRRIAGDQHDPGFLDRVGRPGQLAFGFGGKPPLGQQLDDRGLLARSGDVGGAKVSTKLDLLGSLLAKVDTLIIGGGMANTFLAACGHFVGKSLCERDLLPTAREIMAKAKAKGRELVLPVDAVVAKTFAANAPSRVVAVDSVGGDEMILDIGPRSIEHVCSVLARVKTLVWNGPFGAFELEPFDIGTVEVAEAAAELTAAGKIVTVAGGGDTVAALNAAGATGRFSYVSTAGGAFLEWLEGKPLPGVEVLRVR